MSRMKCAHCNIYYPPELLSPVVTDSGNTAPVCGICALEMSNNYHGETRTKFSGPIAEGMRQGAIEWRKTHPDKKEK